MPTRSRVLAMAGRPVVDTQEILALRLSPLWRFFLANGLAFAAMCFYLVVEYVRPQQLFPFLRGIPLGQIALGLGLAAHVATGRLFDVKEKLSWLFLAFTAVIVASSFTAYDSAASFQELWQIWIPWVVIYFLIVNVVNTEGRLAFFLILWMLCHYYMSQGGARQFAGRGFRFAVWGVTGAPGWFDNSGEFGIAMCMFVAISWHFYLAARPYLNAWRKAFVLGMPITAIIGIIGSSSRGAVLGLAAVVGWELCRTRRVRTVVGAGLLAVAVWFIIPPEQKGRFSTAGEDQTSTIRVIYWKAGLDMARQHPVLGIGYGNWIPYYARFYSDRSDGKVQVSHNIFVQCVAELGYIGLVVLLVLIVASLWTTSQTRKLVRAGRGPPSEFLIHLTHGLDAGLVGYLVAGFFVTVLYYPFFWINLALTVSLMAIARQRIVSNPARPTVSPVLAQAVVRNGRFGRLPVR